MRIRLDKARCTGHGRCYSLSPQLFEPDEYGHGVQLTTEISDSLESVATMAMENCPERAISIEE